MTREQMEAHLALHGWFPAKDADKSPVLIREGHPVLRLTEQRQTAFQVGVCSDVIIQAWERHRVEWSDLGGDTVFWEFANYVCRKGWA